MNQTQGERVHQYVGIVYPLGQQIEYHSLFGAVHAPVHVGDAVGIPEVC